MHHMCKYSNALFFRFAWHLIQKFASVSEKHWLLIAVRTLRDKPDLTVD